MKIVQWIVMGLCIFLFCGCSSLKKEGEACERDSQCEGLMAGGGWIASPGNGITPDIPWENLVAFFDALEEYSYYA